MSMSSYLVLAVLSEELILTSLCTGTWLGKFKLPKKGILLCEGPLPRKATVFPTRRSAQRAIARTKRYNLNRDAVVYRYSIVHVREGVEQLGRKRK